MSAFFRHLTINRDAPGYGVRHIVRVRLEALGYQNQHIFGFAWQESYFSKLPRLLIDFAGTEEHPTGAHVALVEASTLPEGILSIGFTGGACWKVLAEEKLTFTPTPALVDQVLDAVGRITGEVPTE